MKEDQSDKIDMQGFQEMLRKRKAPKPARKKLQSNNSFNKNDGPPKWLVNNQLRWSNFRKKEGETTRIRVIPNANGELFHEYHSTWLRKGQSGATVISNAWNGERPLPCLLYDAYEKAYEDGGFELAKTYRSSSKFAVTAVLLHWFYEVPKEVGERTYYNYVRVPAPGPHGPTEDPRYANCNKVFGRVQYLDFYGSQKDDFLKQLEAVASNCMNCKQGTITPVAFSCENCGNVFGDVREAAIPPDELKFLASGKRLQCEACGHRAAPIIENICSEFKGYDGARPVYEPGCDNPIKIDLSQPFDLVVKTDKIGGKWAFEVKDISMPQDIDELGAHQENPKASLVEPMNFLEFLSQIDLDSQAKAMGVDNPYDKDVQKIIDEYFEAAPEEEDADSIPF